MIISIEGGLSPSRLEIINHALFQYLENFKVLTLKNPHFYTVDNTLLHSAKGEFEQGLFLQELKKVYAQNTPTFPLIIDVFCINHQTNLPVELIKNFEKEHYITEIIFQYQDGKEQITEKTQSKSWGVTENTPEVASRTFLYGVFFLMIALLWWCLLDFTL